LSEAARGGIVAEGRFIPTKLNPLVVGMIQTTSATRH
jgi:hypothetical protein